jgi:hypothetical protein
MHSAPAGKRYRHVRFRESLPGAGRQSMTRLVLSVLLLCQAHSFAQSGPRPPCGGEAVPPYPELDKPPIAESWSVSQFGYDWRPPECTGWVAPGFSTLITTVARFRYAAESEGLLRRAGAISELAGMRYWSTPHTQWQTLIVSARALTGAQAGRRRGDFTSAEMQQGKTLYLEQADNLSGSAVYRMRIVEASADRIVFSVENTGPIRYLFLTLFDPGEMQSVYFLDRESDGVWRYYSIVRIGRNASVLARGHAASAINRAVAFYRSLVGIPTEQDPPAAR